jgi:hypothetical protein
VTRKTRPPARPVTPRQPSAPRQPARPERTACTELTETTSAWPPRFAVVVWIAPELRKRNPDMPLSLYEALNLGREPEPDREAEP